MSYDCFVLEADLWKVDITEKVWEVRLATSDRFPTGQLVWERQALSADAGRDDGQRLRLNVMVKDPEDPDAVQRVRKALFLDEDAELPF